MITPYHLLRCILQIVSCCGYRYVASILEITVHFHRQLFNIVPAYCTGMLHHLTAYCPSEALAVSGFSRQPVQAAVLGAMLEARRDGRSLAVPIGKSALSGPRRERFLLSGRVVIREPGSVRVGTFEIEKGLGAIRRPGTVRGRPGSASGRDTPPTHGRAPNRRVSSSTPCLGCNAVSSRSCCPGTG